MKKFLMRALLCALMLSLLLPLFAACGGSGGETETQPAPETEKQSETEKQTETEPETVPGSESATEAETGTEPETEPAETEPATETEPASETEPAATETERATETEPETETETEKPTETETEPENLSDGYRVTFLTDSHVRVVVYRTQEDQKSDNGTVATVAYSREGETGVLTKAGGQINFKLVCEEGYVAAIAEDGILGDYKNLRTPRALELSGAYRITKVASDMTVNIVTYHRAAESTSDGYRVTFVTGTGVSVTAFDNQQAYEGNTSGVAYSRDGITGEITKTDGQVNFRIDLADGYVLDTLTVTGDYSNCKNPSDTEETAVYRITKIASPITVSVTAKKASAEDPANGYAVSFSHDSHVRVYVYRMQDYTVEPELSDTAVSRNGDTGAITREDGQVNFLVVCDEGYVATVNATGSFKNLKLPDDTGKDDVYRLTKITGAVTVTITVKPE